MLTKVKKASIWGKNSWPVFNTTISNKNRVLGIMSLNLNPATIPHGKKHFGKFSPPKSDSGVIRDKPLHKTTTTLNKNASGTSKQKEQDRTQRRSNDRPCPVAQPRPDFSLTGKKSERERERERGREREE